MNKQFFLNRLQKIRPSVFKQYSYDLVPEVFNGSGSLTIKCSKHGDFVQRASSHLAGNKCKKCHFEDSREPIEDFIVRAKEIHGNKYDYSKAIHLGTKIPLEIVCPIHGSFWQRPNSHISSKAGCQICSESKGEVAVALILKKYKLNHIREYKIKPYSYRYDFYLPEFNIFIEFNGIQHYNPVEIFGGIEGLESIKKNDEIKKQLVRDNQGKLIILTYSSLTDNLIEDHLIKALKRIYRYWFIIDDRLFLYKSASSVFKAFNIPLSTLVSNLEIEVGKTVPNFYVLF